MHGYDWEALRQQYKPLLEHVAHRTDLNYVNQMLSENIVIHQMAAGGFPPGSVGFPTGGTPLISKVSPSTEEA